MKDISRIWIEVVHNLQGSMPYGMKEYFMEGFLLRWSEHGLHRGIYLSRQIEFSTRVFTSRNKNTLGNLREQLQVSDSLCDPFSALYDSYNLPSQLHIQKP